MLIEQIIKFELRGLGPLGRFQATGYLYDKAKTYKENLRVDYCLPQKFYKRPNHLQNLASKCKILNEFWT